MSQLPADPKVRKIINDAIEESVEAKFRAEAELSFITDTAERIQEETEMPKAEFKKRVAIRLLQNKNESKYLEEKDWADTAYEENEILSKTE